MPYLGLRGTPLLVFITVTAGMGWVLFGLEDGTLGSVISSTPFEDKFQLNSTMQGTVTGVFELGCFLGALLVSAFGERFSRRWLLFLYTIPMVIGSTLQVASQDTAMLIVGRIIAGVSMGGVSSTLPMWQSETAPAKYRGTVICCSLSFLVLGQVIAYWAAYGLLQAHPTSDLTWRLMFSLQMIACVIMAIMAIFMPESPRYLISHERYAEARQVLAALANLPEDDVLIAEQLEDITTAIRHEREVSKTWSDLFKKDNNGSREKQRMITGVIIQFCQPFSGSTVISYYVTTIFEDSVGFDANLASMMSGYLQVFFLFASFGTWWLIEHAGRRKCFMITALCMAITMVILGVMVKINTHTSGIVAAVMIFAYQAFYTWGWMAGVWTYSNEIMSNTYRSKGMGLAVALQWLFDFVLLQITPPGIANIGWKIYLIFAIFNLCFIPFVYFFCPETAGVPLEAIDAMYVPGVNPVLESRSIRRRIKQEKADLVETGAVPRDGNTGRISAILDGQGVGAGRKVEGAKGEQVQIE